MHFDDPRLLSREPDPASVVTGVGDDHATHIDRKHPTCSKCFPRPHPRHPAEGDVALAQRLAAGFRVFGLTNDELASEVVIAWATTAARELLAKVGDPGEAAALKTTI